MMKIRSLKGALLAAALCNFGCAHRQPQAPSDPRFRQFIREPFASAVSDAAPGRAVVVTPSDEASNAGEPSEPGSPARGVGHPTWIALVIGIEKYGGTVPASRGARRDAEEFRDLAIKSLGVPSQRVHTLLDEEATQGRIEQQLIWLRDNSHKRGNVIFYFAGHGTADHPDSGATKPEPYLMPHDVDPVDVNTTGIRLSQVVSRLRQADPANVVAIIDACYSGTDGRSVAAHSRAVLREQVPLPDRTVIFSAAGIGQVAGPTRRGDRGLFSSTISAGFENLAADIDGNGELTMDELVAWVTPRVKRLAHDARREQSPTLFNGVDAHSDALILGEFMR